MSMLFGDSLCPPTYGTAGYIGGIGMKQKQDNVALSVGAAASAASDTKRNESLTFCCCTERYGLKGQSIALELLNSFSTRC